MATGPQYKELRALTVEAAEILRERRVALIAGCSLTSIQCWLRRPQGHIMPRTVEQTLPRMRRWREWIPGYTAATAEIEGIEAQAPTLDALTDEYCTRLTHAEERWTLMQIAYACEVPVSHLQRWGAGVVPKCERAEVIRAVGHLRHITLWPDLPPANNRAPMVAMPIAAGTAC